MALYNNNFSCISCWAPAPWRLLYNNHPWVFLLLTEHRILRSRFPDTSVLIGQAGHKFFSLLDHLFFFFWRVMHSYYLRTTHAVTTEKSFMCIAVELLISIIYVSIYVDMEERERRQIKWNRSSYVARSHMVVQKIPACQWTSSGRSPKVKAEGLSWKNGLKNSSDPSSNCSTVIVHDAGSLSPRGQLLFSQVSHSARARA